ncbi:uncharacterized protein N7483_004929 [Penicillium malachiteum]|uniref:uncharacterized protein n=1 Tax=Penicillium malachiteum TaxID=1324776 RepID=UPI002548BC42|nr:uncharacterized protein N7483_004929 [Penicillium malachiteum]KAJ5730421.1 hypothetical protein N7483_004929 [Penicillium malachiteum]
MHNVCISDEGNEDMPINKLTSFNGKLNKFLHLGNMSDSSATEEIPFKSTPTPPMTSRRGQPTTENNPMATQNISNCEESITLTKKRDVKSSPKRNSKSPPILPSSTIQKSQITRSSALTSTPTISSELPAISPSPSLRRKRRPQTPLDTPPASTSLLRDTIPANLILLLVGVNPGLKTGITGHAYAHPSNLFWRLLHSSGITSIRHPPSDTYKLPELYSVGNTNIVVRPTRDASMLSRAEMDAGVPILEAKVAAQQPEAVCLVGKGIWEAVWRVRHGRGIRKEEFQYGWQRESENMGCVVGESWGGARVFVATTTSGLAAGMTLTEKEIVWAELGDWVVRRRAERKKEVDLIAPKVEI